MKTLKKICFMFAFTLIAILLNSCTEDPVKPPPGDPQIEIIDSNIFNWRFIPVPTELFFDYYVIDTNNIYYVGDERVYYYNGASFQIIYYGPESTTNISGHNAENIYFGGYKYINNGVYPWLKKWNGVSTIDIPMPLDSNYSVEKIYTLSTDNVWISSHSGVLYHYHQDTVVRYQLNITNVNIPAFFEYGNDLFYYLHNSSSSTITHSIYKFTGNEWIEYSKDAVPYDNLQFRLSTSVINDTLLRRRKKSIDLFNGINWQCATETRLFEPYSMAGTSTNSFLSSGLTENYCNMYYYAGEKWLYQSKLLYPENDFFGFPVDLVYSNNTYFGFYYPVTGVNHNYILVGNLK